MTKISLYDIFTGSATTKFLEPGAGISLDYSDDFHSIILSLSGLGPDIPVDISTDLNPTLGGNLNVNGHSIISGPGQNISLSPGLGGHIVLNGLNFPTEDGANGDLLGTDGNGNLVWYKVPGITNSQIGTTYYVDQSVPTTGTGTKESPFKTLPEAIAVAQNGDSIAIYTGTYTGNFLFARSINLIAMDNANVRIFGHSIISNTTTLQSQRVNFENNADFALDNNGTFIMDGGSIVRDNDYGMSSIGSVTIKNALIQTRINSQGPIELINVDSNGGLISTYDSLILRSAIKAPMIDHASGTVEIRNAPAFDYDHDGSSLGQDISIKSASNTGYLIIDNVSLKQSTGWSKIQKSGTCDWVINNVGRNPLHDVLNGNRQYFITEASDLSSYYKPINYSITTDASQIRDQEEASITDHLIGIDAKLGESLFSPANIWWVSTDGQDTNSGSSSQPFLTLSHAIAQAVAGDTIVVIGGDYANEVIVIDKDLNIIGLENPVFTNTTVELSNGAFMKMDKIQVASATDVPLTVTNGSFDISNSKFESNLNNAIEIAQLSSDSQIDHTKWVGKLINSDTSGHKLVIAGVNDSRSALVTNSSTSKTYLRDSAFVGSITHTLGYLSIVNVGQIESTGSGKSIVSTAPNAAGNYLFINLTSTKQDDGSYGIVEKTGTCDYQLGLNDIGSANTFTGNGQMDLISSDQIHVDYTPQSYTATDVLTDHIHQIDTKLGQAVIRPSRLYYVDTVDGLNEIYSSITETTFGFDSTIYITPGAIAQFILNTQFVPGINLIGTGSAENVIVQMPTGIPHLHITSALSGMVHETLWRDIKLNSPVIVEQSLADDEIHFENMTINGDITVNYGKLIIRNSRINGILTIAGGSVELWNCELLDRVAIGDGELYINSVKQYITSSYSAFDITGGSVIIDSIRASNTTESIFKVQGGKTVVSSLIIDSNSFDTVIYQDIGGSIYLGMNNIVAEGKTVSGTVLTLGFGL